MRLIRALEGLQIFQCVKNAFQGGKNASKCGQVFIEVFILTCANGDSQSFRDLQFILLLLLCGVRVFRARNSDVLQLSVLILKRENLTGIFSQNLLLKTKLSQQNQYAH
eukprot:TRINITY_DN4787_c0_g1_i10.p5 TRINITY_DN4787_c0_g1~~TRINITY_DN4787_c0_g1_i10.p5  ORF type:complete len:109 (-),score=3.86 TRINITY_DN4787_c0_g1_i10:1331-1657(-)